MPYRRPSVAALLSGIPSTPGVYLFYGSEDALLYVGKSKTLRARVRAHFRDRSERWMTSRIRRIETRNTAGELGALLLESELIKTLRPMYNVASRQRRRIIIAVRKPRADGYVGVALNAVDAIDPSRSEEILGVFKHTTQAKEFLAAAAKVHRLCPLLLGLETTRHAADGALRPCFSYHLGQCSGACIGDEPAAPYNERVERAFLDRRIKAWPHSGGLIVEERAGERTELFLVDNWCLVGTLSRTEGSDRPFLATQHRFDYDTYKILYAFISNPPQGMLVRPSTSQEWESMIRIAGNEPERPQRRARRAVPAERP